MATPGRKQQLHLPPSADGGEPEAKRARPSESSDSARAHPRVVLNPADCDLDFDVSGNGLQGQALHEEGFAYCWSGARATIGMTGGKYCFGCKIISEQKVQMEDTAPDQQHLCRLGISRGDDPVGNLGESGHSFGFGGTGKFSTMGKFSDYGAKFGVGDTIVCSVNLEDQPFASIGYSLNGKWLGAAKQFDAGPRGLGVLHSTPSTVPWKSALFPHVLLKNVMVQMQFCVEDGLLVVEGYKPWSSALQDGNAIIGPSFLSPKECEVMMMVGLPASGKTTWAEKWVKDHPEKRYLLLGTNLALDQMKVPGLLRKQNYGERFDRLMDRATKIFNTLLSRACKTPRNYIIDQTNVYKSARKRKLQPFVNFHKIAVVIFPAPNELKIRADKRFKEMGKEVPAEAVNQMLANYVLPVSKDMLRADESFDQVLFPELDRSEAQRYLDEMKHDLRSNADLSGKTSFSPYSRKGSVQSSSSVSFSNDRISSASDGRWQTSNLSSSYPIDNPRTPVQVKSSYFGNPEFSGACRGLSPSQSISYHSSYGNYNRGSPMTSEHDSYRRHAAADPYDRSPISFGSFDTFTRYKTNDSYSSPVVDARRLDQHGYGDRGTHFPSTGAHMYPGEMTGGGDYPVRNEGSFGHQNYFTRTPPGGHRADLGSTQFARNPYEQQDHLTSAYGSPFSAPRPNPPYRSSMPPEQWRSGGYPPQGSGYR